MGGNEGFWIRGNLLDQILGVLSEEVNVGLLA